MAAIRNLDRSLVTDGLQGCFTCDEAIIAARNIARDQGQAVILEDDDGEWRVEPDGSCEPEED